MGMPGPSSYIRRGNQPGDVERYIGFLERVEQASPSQMAIHLVTDDVALQRSPGVRSWISKRFRFQVHLASSHRQWLDEIDRWFQTKAYVLAGVSEPRSEDCLMDAVDEYLRIRLIRGLPFTWVKSATAIERTLIACAALVFGGAST